MENITAMATTTTTVKHTKIMMVTCISVETVENEHDTWLCAKLYLYYTSFCVIQSE